jgi:uncharacterized coiled-coil protein SlyX
VNVVPTGGLGGDPHRRHDDLDWKRRIPKWAYLTGWVVMALIIGWLWAKVQVGSDRDSRRIEAAIIDSPSKYQARLSERVAVNEAQIASIVRSVDGLTTQVDRQNAAAAKLTTQMELLTQELRQARKNNAQR